MPVETTGGPVDGLQGWLEERFWRHRGNADVLRQELLSEKGLAVSLRTVERSVAPLRREMRAAARATVRFETPPGRQLQIDFGERRTVIDGETVRAYLFVATLGYSRRLHVRAFRHERQECWSEGLESAFRAFGGSTEEVLLDNARALVDRHDTRTREVVFNARFAAFAKHWRIRPSACAPYRARTKGKDERGVGYVKSSAIAAAASPVGPRSRGISTHGRARLRTSGCMARPAKRRWRGFAADEAMPCGRLPGCRRSTPPAT